MTSAETGITAGAAAAATAGSLGSSQGSSFTSASAASAASVGSSGKTVPSVSSPGVGPLCPDSPDWVQVEGSPMMVFSLDGQMDVPSLPLAGSRFASVYAHGLEGSPSDSPQDVDADQVSQLFDEVLDRDPAARAEGLARLLTVLWRSIASEIGPDGRREPGPLLLAHLHTIIRWSCTAPFEDIRDSLSEFLDQLRSVHVHLDADAQVEAVSTFMAPDEIVRIDSDDAETRNQLEALFLSEGRISHLMRVMVIQPKYQSCFDMAINFLLRDSGPLPRPWRSYIGIMSSAQHSCGYMVQRLEIEFLDVGGEESWLTGLSEAAPKLALLVELNAILARQPWGVNEEHIAKLTGGDDAWTHAEVAHAIVLMSAFHSLCSFVLGCGLGPELDFRDRESRSHLRMLVAPDELRTQDSQGSSHDETVKLIDQLRSGSREDGDEEEADGQAGGGDEPPAAGEELPPPVAGGANGGAAFSDAESDVPLPGPRPAELQPEPEPEPPQQPPPVPAELQPEPELRIEQDQEEGDSEDAYSYLLSEDERAKYCVRTGEAEISVPYIDFDTSTMAALDLNESSWDELGYSIVAKYVGDDAAKLLDDEFRAATTASDRRVGFEEEDVDTEPYRLAIWYDKADSIPLTLRIL